ncbi:6917_t:CDS:2, partial [Entrophospora sp. SA101]
VETEVLYEDEYNGIVDMGEVWKGSRSVWGLAEQDILINHLILYQESSKNAKIDKILVPKPGLGTIEVVPVE